MAQRGRDWEKFLTEVVTLSHLSVPNAQLWPNWEETPGS